jgi:peptide deformylase
MTTLSILEYPDARLRGQTSKVTAFDANLARFADDLIETLRASNGVGLAAPQVNDPRRVLVLDLSDTRTEPQLFINPEILSRRGQCRVEESCLSVPGVMGSVMRAWSLTVRSQTLAGTECTQEITGPLAVCLQHEMDHLDGILFIDRLSWIERLRTRFGRRPHSGSKSDAVLQS